jgi:Ca-activated chloride channel homolog
MEKNFYAYLGLPTDATPDEIKHAYRKAARRLHPDANPAPEAVETFLIIQQAYEVLSESKRRAAYDAALPPELKTFEKIAVHLDYSRTTIQPRVEEQILYVLLTISAKLEEGEQPETPLNICLMVDTSTSMKGAALETVKQAALDLVGQLRPIDYLSIVSFNDRAEVLLPSTSSKEQDKARLAIRMLRTGGGTEIGKGLEAGYKEILKYSRFDTISHMILMTDGRTYGDEALCLRVAEGAALEGIVINGIGIGSRWNDVFLDSLASKTGGSSFFVDDFKDIDYFLKDKFRTLKKRYAERVILDLDPAPGVKLNYAMRLQPEAAPLELQLKVILGSLSYNIPLSLLFEFHVKGVEECGDFQIASRFLSYVIPSIPNPNFTKRLSLHLPVKESPASSPPQSILEAISRLTLYRMQENAQLDLEKGDHGGASLRLKRLATRLISRGEDRLASTIFHEADNLERNKTISEEGNKRIKYGTRSLVFPASYLRDEEQNI